MENFLCGGRLEPPGEEEDKSREGGGMALLEGTNGQVSESNGHLLPCICQHAAHENLINLWMNFHLISF